MTNLQTKKAQLAEIERQIESEKPMFEEGEIIYFPVFRSHGALECTYDKVTKDHLTIISNSKEAPRFLFKYREQCESFNKKLLELAEREARILYGVVEKPGSARHGFSNLVNFDSEHQRLYIRDMDRDCTVTILTTMEIELLRNYCNQCLDFLEQQEANK